MLTDTVHWINHQLDYLWVVDNASDPPVRFDLFPPDAKVFLVHDPSQPPNLATLWNKSLDTIAAHAEAHHFDRWDVALLCDDVSVPHDWYDRVSGVLRNNNASAASAHQMWDLHQMVLKVRPDSDIVNRMCGWAFILPGEKGMRANEEMHWWWLDTDVDWQARAADGMVLAPGAPALNRLPNHWTVTKPNLGAQAGLDRAAFERRWGACPW
jgi:hypothetical protein